MTVGNGELELDLNEVVARDSWDTLENIASACDSMARGQEAL